MINCDLVCDLCLLTQVFLHHISATKWTSKSVMQLMGPRSFWQLFRHDIMWRCAIESLLEVKHLEVEKMFRREQKRGSISTLKIQELCPLWTEDKQHQHFLFEFDFHPYRVRHSPSRTGDVVFMYCVRSQHESQRDKYEVRKQQNKGGERTSILHLHRTPLPYPSFAHLRFKPMVF